MSRSTAVRIVRQHGWETWQNTTYTQNGGTIWGEVAGTSFDAMLGIKKHYSSREVYDWLGY